MVVNHEKCTGCSYCTLVCSMTKEGVIDRSRSHIKIHKDDAKGLAIPILCEHCENPPCIQACPNDSISKDHKTGTVSIDSGMCTGCGACLKSCPFRAIHVDPEKNIATICDLCKGNPRCAEICNLRVAPAIKWVDATLSAVLRKRELAQNRLDEMVRFRRRHLKCTDGLERSSM